VASDDPFASDPFRAGDLDPFAAGDAGPSFPPSPAAADAPADDPFAASGALLARAADPFAASVVPRGASASPLPVTDLSDLLGEPTPPSLRGPRSVPPPIPPPLPDAPASHRDVDTDDRFGLSLEERLTPPPAPVPSFGEPELPPPPLGFEPGGFGGSADPGAFEPSALDGGGASELSLALATEPPPAAPPAPTPRAARRAARPTPLPDPVPAPAPTLAPERAEPPPDRIPGGRGARARSLAVNAAALAALLLVAFALLAVWRSGGRLASLRPAVVLAGLRGGAAAPFRAEGVTSGLYERDGASPLLFVRGRAVSSASAPVNGLRVRVEILRDGEVVARGDALAGAVPGAEELWGARDADALAAVGRAAAARAPRPVKPGEPVPFLVAIADHPADLAGASLRVTVEAAAR
jgi:hypothetical protein